MNEENLFNEMNRHLLEDDKPSIYLKSILYKIKNSNLSIIAELENVEQNPQHHPEGNVLNHTLLVVDAAALVREYANDKRALMWVALFHDVGKKKATKLRKGKLTAYDHDQIGYKEMQKVLNNYDFLYKGFKEKVLNMEKYHMHSLYLAKNLPFGNIEQMILDVEMNDMILLFFADKLGRGDFTPSEIKRVISEIIVIIDKLEGKYNIDLSSVLNKLMKLFNKQ